MSKNNQIDVKVVQPENSDAVLAEVLASAIVNIANGFEAIRKSRLSRRAVELLVRDASGEGMNSVRNVLNGIENLKKLYIK